MFLTRLAASIGALASASALALLPHAAAATAPSAPIPAYDHVLLVIFENHEQSNIVGAADAAYLTALARQGANFTRSFAIEHPSEPNYLDLFSGSNQGVRKDSCPHTFAADNIGHQLIAAGKTFAGYSEDLPAAGSDTCRSGRYARKHNPWSNFADLDQSAVSLPYTAFPTDFDRLPSYSWLVPNLCHDMHDCPVSTGDGWARSHLDAYAQWAKTHNSLLIVTFDEDDAKGENRIPTVLVGARVRPGDYTERVDHYTVLRTVEDLFGLPALGNAASRRPITDVFTAGGS